MYRRILLPTDGSDGSHRAIDHAVALADEVGAAVHGLYVVNTSEFDELNSASLEAIEDDGEAALERVRRATDRVDVPTETSIRYGTPHEEILDAAEEFGADTIVMGTHGRTGIDRVLVGSVTERVVRESPVPVTTVRVTGEGDDSIPTPEAARTRAKEALKAAGYDSIGFEDDPHRGPHFWIVPVATSEGEARVHIDAATGSARVASTDR